MGYLPDNAHSFSTPFFSTAIITNPDDREGTRHPLWTLDESTSPILALGSGAFALAFLAEISITLNLGYIPRITATLTPPLDLARQFIESDLVEWTKSILTVRYGYTGDNGWAVQSPEFEGLILKPEVTLGTDVSVTLTAQGVGGLTGTRTSSDTANWMGKSYFDVFKALGDIHGWTVDESAVADAASKVTPPTAPSFLQPSAPSPLAPATIPPPAKKTEMDLLHEVHSTIFFGNLADWYWVMRTAKEIGCWVYLDSSNTAKNGNKSLLRLLPINGSIASKPEYTFVLYDLPDDGTGHAGFGASTSGSSTSFTGTSTFPILSITTPTSAIYLSGVTKRIRALGYDPDKRKVVQVIADDKTSVPTRTDKDKGAGIKKDVDASKGEIAAFDGAAPDAQKIADEEYKSAIQNMGIKIEVETLGVPNLRPGQIITVRGVSKGRIDGEYAVFEVTHSLGSGGFSTKFTAYSNVGQLMNRIGEQLVPASAPTQTPDQPWSPDHYIVAAKAG